MKDEISLKDLKFSFDLKDTKYELDVLQNKMLEFYIRASPIFRQAFYMNYTNEFLQFIKDKTRLNEPITLSVMGNTRTFTDNNKIYTKYGWKKPSEMELYKPSKVLSYNFDLEKYEWKNFKLVKRNRDIKEKFYKITFSDNREIEIGENHPIFTLDKGWKKAFSLYSNIKIPFFSDYNIQEQTEDISLEKVRIISFLLSCGHLNNSSFMSLDKRDMKYYKKIIYNISYSKDDIEMIKQYQDDFLKVFGVIPKFKKKRLNHNGIEVEIGNKEIFQELNKYIPSGKKANIIEIPSIIFNSSKEIQKEFISVLFSGDGYVGNPLKQNIVEYYSTSEIFIRQLQLMLIQYGIISYIKKKNKTKKSHNNLWRLTITNRENIFNFRNFVGKLYYPLKENRLKEMCKNIQNIGKHLIPRKFYIKHIQEIFINDSFIYDIFVEDNNNFFLNGILTHNSGKSYSSISICAFHQACYNKKFTIDYICANAFEYLDKLKTFSQDKLTNRIFLIDEEKQTIFGTGSYSKKMKLLDVRNIIAINNISTINLNPNSWANKDSNYGLKSFGRCFKTKTCRFMMYNLQEHGSGSEKPMGNIYLPIFTEFLPKDYADEIEKPYLKKKNEWVMQEQKGTSDVLSELKKKSAVTFTKDKNYMSLKKKGEKITYISVKLGSEWTKGEVLEIYEITKLLESGMLKEDELR